MSNGLAIIRRCYEKIPPDSRRKFGKILFDSAVKTRRKILGAEEKSTKISDGYVSWLHVDNHCPETVLFLHGFGDNKDNFFDAARLLAKNYNLVIPDLPGFGQSFKSVDAVYDLPAYGKWLSEFLESIELDEFHLAGNSLGGGIALQLTLLNPDKVKTLTVIDPAGFVGVDDDSVYQELVSGRNIFKVNSAQEFESFMDRVFCKKRPFIPPFIKDHITHDFISRGEWHEYMIATTLSGVTSLRDDRVKGLSLNEELPKIGVPTLILWGDNDTLFPHKWAHEMCTLIPNSQAHVFSDMGHSVQMERPSHFVSVYETFLGAQGV